MSTYRPMERARHTDERVQKVHPIARAVWDYVCCNLQDHPSGLYRLSIATACEDTGWETKEFEAGLEALEGVGLLARDKPVRLVWVRNMMRKSYPGKKLSENQMRGVSRHLESMPKTDLVGEMVRYYRERYSWVIPCSTLDDGLPDPCARVLKDPPLGTVRIGTVNPSEQIPAWVDVPPGTTPPMNPGAASRAALFDVLTNTEALRIPSGCSRIFVPQSFDSDYVGTLDEVMAELATAADRVDAKHLAMEWWKGTALLSPNGYPRMVADNAAWRAAESKKAKTASAVRPVEEEEAPPADPEMLAAAKRVMGIEDDDES